LLPWLKAPEDIIRRTIKIEVMHENEIILQRYLHFGKLYPIEYSKLALLISFNMYQGQYARYKQRFVAEKEVRSAATRVTVPKPQAEKTVVASKLGDESSKGTGPHVSQLENASLSLGGPSIDTDLILVFDGAENVGIHSEQGVARRATNASGQEYFFTEPAKDRNYRALESLRLHRFGLKDIINRVLDQEILPNAGIVQSDLLKFPRFLRSQDKILLEF
jgi:hypothetical protein